MLFKIALDYSNFEHWILVLQHKQFIIPLLLFTFNKMSTNYRHPGLYSPRLKKAVCRHNHDCGMKKLLMNKLN